MTALTPPSFLVPNQLTWHLEPNTGVFVSPLSRTTQTVELPGARWVCEMTMPPLLNGAQRGQYSAWLAKMRGQAGRVYVTPPHYRGPTSPSWVANLSAVTCDSTVVTCDSTITVNQSSVSTRGSPVVDGADQDGVTLRTTGWTNDIATLMAGDFISYDTSRGRTLHMVVEDAESDGAGNCALILEPPIRTSPADGAAIEIETPSCIMTLNGTMVGAPNIGLALRLSAQLSMVEVF